MADIKRDRFASLFNPDFCADTGLFSAFYRNGITLSHDPLTALTRFLVQSITFNKIDYVEHGSYITVKVLDKETKLPHIFHIECNDPRAVSNLQLRGSTCQCSPALPSESSPTAHAASEPLNSKTYPLLNLNDSESSSADSAPAPPACLLSSSPSSSVSLHLPLPKRSESQYGDSEILTLPVIFTKMRISSAVLSFAAFMNSLRSEDRILGKGSFFYLGRVIDKMIPNIDMSLYEIVILADVIYDSLNCNTLDKHFFRFARTLFEVVRLLYGDKLGVKKSPALVPRDYLPDMAVRFKNVMIALPEDETIKQVAIKFTQRQGIEFSEGMDAHVKKLRQAKEREISRLELEARILRLEEVLLRKVVRQLEGAAE